MELFVKINDFDHKTREMFRFLKIDTNEHLNKWTVEQWVPPLYYIKMMDTSVLLSQSNCEQRGVSTMQIDKIECYKSVPLSK